MLVSNMPNASLQLDAMLQAFPDLLLTIDDNGTILDYKGSEAVSTLFAPPETFVGQRAADILPSDFTQSLTAAMQQLKSSGGPASFEYSRQQAGSRRWFEARLVRSAPGQAVVVVRDTTRHKQAEERMNAQLKRMASLRAIDLAISSSLDLHLALSVILSQVTAQLAVDAADILLIDSQNMLEFTTGVGFRTEALQRTRVPIGQGFAGVVAAKREVVSIPDLRQGKAGFMKSEKFLEEGFRSYFGAPLVSKGRVRGVLEIFHRREISPDGDWLDFMEALAGEAAIAVENATLFKELQRTNLELTLAYDTTIEGWSRALDLRDRDTEGHTQRVTYAAVKLARRLGLDESEVIQIRRGAMLHDIGKMAIPDSILFKAEPLTPEEWVEIRQHPRYAFELLGPIAYLGPALDIPHYHHEKWDGSGYPHGLREHEIPQSARLFSVIDVFDALTSPRPYRAAWDKVQALSYIQDQAGKHFDPDITGEFVRMIQASKTRDLTIPT
jgi:PAS domain S-box-containing protein